MKFNAFAKLCRHDVEKYRAQYSSMLDISGTVASNTIGFHFSINEPADQAEVNEMIKTFQPIAILAGTKSLQDKLGSSGHQSVISPFFEEGGFMVVLKIPHQ